MKNSFGELFKILRLKAGFSSLSEFGRALAEKGFIFEESIFSRWQKGNRIPRDRNFLLTLIKIFIEKGSIVSIREANIFLEIAGQGYLTEPELRKVTEFFATFEKLPSPRKTVEFLTKIGKSKNILRSGWV